MPRAEEGTHKDSIIDHMVDYETLVMTFEKGLSFAAGRKVLYFSAINKDIEFKDERIKRVSGVNYVNPAIGRDGHYLEAKIAHPHLKAESFQSPSFLDEERNFDNYLPMMLREHQKAINISEITDEQAANAGFISANKFRLMLALQSDHAPEFVKILQEYMKESLGVVASNVMQGYEFSDDEGSKTLKVTEEKLPMYLHGLTANVLGVLRSDINPAEIANPIYKPFVEGIINDLVQKVLPSEIPGQVNIYSVRVAHPDEMVKSGLYADEGVAKKRLSESLRYFPHFLRNGGFTVDTNNLLHYLKRKYTERGLNQMLDKLSQRADEVALPQTPAPSTRVTMYKQINDARLSGDLPQDVATDLGFAVAKCGGNAAMEEEVKARFQEALEAERKKRDGGNTQQQVA